MQTKDTTETNQTAHWWMEKFWGLQKQYELLEAESAKRQKHEIQLMFELAELRKTLLP